MSGPSSPTQSSYPSLSTNRALAHAEPPVDDGDVTDLKLETLAQFDREAAGPSRRRREEEEELEYVVHRDAGRVRELPPRYEELKWEEEERRE